MVETERKKWQKLGEIKPTVRSNPVQICSVSFYATFPLRRLRSEETQRRTDGRMDGWTEGGEDLHTCCLSVASSFRVRLLVCCLYFPRGGVLAFAAPPINAKNAKRNKSDGLSDFYELGEIGGVGCCTIRTLGGSRSYSEHGELPTAGLRDSLADVPEWKSVFKLERERKKRTNEVSGEGRVTLRGLFLLDDAAVQ